MAFTSKQIRDIDTLRAIAHPLRMSLLAELRRAGPATASDLGRRLGETSGSTSYHLRQLERFGFIVEAGEQPSGRERHWSAAHDMTSFDEDLWQSEEGRELFDQVRRRQLESLKKGLNEWDGPMQGIGHSDYLLRLDPADLEQLAKDLDEVIGRYADRNGEQAIALHVLTLPDASS